MVISPEGLMQHEQGDGGKTGFILTAIVQPSGLSTSVELDESPELRLKN
uniref:Uncharacterized protein n=1 Tax=Cyanothece sp. (strain PCC 7425 / ATCC 29141) TaxID=395961 RepID=B8HW25_CYAP4